MATAFHAGGCQAKIGLSEDAKILMRWLE